MTSVSHVRELDGLRGILATWVAVSHVICLTGNSGAAWAAPAWVQHAWFTFITAQVAVSVFIILSGFAISALLDRGVSAGAFMRNRFWRIYPVYLVCLALGASATPLYDTLLDMAPWASTRYYVGLSAIHASEQSAPLTHLLAHLTLLNGAIPAEMLPSAVGTFLPPAWSITLEWQYYLAAIPIAAALRSVRGVLLIAAASIAGDLTSAYWASPMAAFLPAKLPLFVIGIASYRLHRLLLEEPGLRRHVPYCSGAIAGGAVIAGWEPLTLVIWAVCFGVVHSPTAGPGVRPLQVSRAALMHSALQYLGRISYPLYLVHWPVILCVIAALLRLAPNISTLGALACTAAVALPASILLAHALHVAVERPMMAYGRVAAERARLQGETRG